MGDFDWWTAVQQVFWAIVISFFTWLGDFGKALHEETHDGPPVTRARILRGLPTVFIISAGSVVVANWLHDHNGYMMLTGAFIGGTLSYIGFEWISSYAKGWLEKIRPGK